MYLLMENPEDAWSILTSLLQRWQLHLLLPPCYRVSALCALFSNVGVEGNSCILSITHISFEPPTHHPRSNKIEIPIGFNLF